MDVRPVAAAVLVILAVVAGIQLADPHVGTDPDPPEVDFSDSPAEVAADSAAQFGSMDYTYRLSFRDDPGDAWRQVWEVHVDRSDREFYEKGPFGENGTHLYATESTGYFRVAPGTAWRFTSRITYPPTPADQPFLAERLRNATTRVKSDNSSHLVVDIDVHPLNTAAYLPGNATLIIEKRTGRIERAYVVYNTQGDPKYLRFEFLEAGTDVHRPAGLPVSIQTMFWDLVRGPLFTLFES